jgi:hypothetical protein
MTTHIVKKYRNVGDKIRIAGVGVKGGHRQYKHLSKKGRVTIAGHPADDVHPKTLNSILKHWYDGRRDEGTNQAGY